MILAQDVQPLQSSRLVEHDQTLRKLILLGLVLGAISFNFALCFVNTNLGRIGTPIVVGSEMVIVSTVFLVTLNSIRSAHLVLILGTILYTATLAMIRLSFTIGGTLDIKAVRDFIIPIAFFMLGQTVKDTKTADFIVIVCTLVVVSVAAFEYLFVDTFLQYFNVIKYYIARGTVGASKTPGLATDLFISGMRPQGRNFLPFLGDHRVSSVFLEPVSLGNFGVIVFFWALVIWRSRRIVAAALLLAALVLLILSDSRFGTAICLLGAGLRLLSPAYWRWGVMILPVICIMGLVEVVEIYPKVGASDDFLGRLIWSALVLSSLNTYNWMGFQDAAITDTFDSGYAYALCEVGVIGVAALWAVFGFCLKRTTDRFQLFHALVGLYVATGLCISYSVFTIKTASLVWFLLGSTCPVKRSSGRSVHLPMARPHLLIS